MVEPRFESGFTQSEAMELAYAEEIDEIFIEPPAATVLTDEDSGEEDGGDTLENLPGALLRSAANFRSENDHAEPERQNSFSKKVNERNIEWIDGINLLNDLREKGYRGTGTVNRIPKNCPLTDKKLMEKTARGTYQSSIARHAGAIFVRWVDNGVVTVASTTYGVQPVGHVR
ncbi:hypothetical protein QE152_g25903 [Popillia japonica]|uniref:PiggyBac transposable element-derived protein domain-containing protein n=1 Tax=Popillia japonica TaxID=7064 RepID=A0AAW1K003_POPJA